MAGAGLAGLFGTDCGIVPLLFHELWANCALLGQLVLLAVFSALLRNLQNAFAAEGVAQVSRAVVFLVLLTVCMYSFSLALIWPAAPSRVCLILCWPGPGDAGPAWPGRLAAAAVFQPVLVTAAGIVGWSAT